MVQVSDESVIRESVRIFPAGWCQAPKFKTVNFHCRTSGFEWPKGMSNVNFTTHSWLVRMGRTASWPGKDFKSVPNWSDPRFGLNISGEAGLRFNPASPADHSAGQQKNISSQGGIVANNCPKTVKAGGNGFSPPRPVNLDLYFPDVRNDAGCGGKSAERNPITDQ